MVKKATEKPQDFDEMGDFYKFMMFVGIGLGLILYLQVLRNRKYWIIMETLFGVVSLLMLPFTDTLIDRYQSTGTNHLAVYLFRLMVFIRVSQSAMIFQTRNSRDSTVAIGISITNILSRSALMMCLFHGIFFTKTISQSSLRMDTVLTTLMIIGDMFQLSKVTTREGNLTIGDPISLHVSIDGIVKFMLASWIFGFPDMFLRVVHPGVVPNEGQLALSRVVGCFVFGSAVLSFASLCFKNHEDAVSLLKSKLAFYVPAVFFGILMCFIDPGFRSLGHILAVIGGFVFLAVNSGYAVWQYEKKKLY